MSFSKFHLLVRKEFINEKLISEYENEFRTLNLNPKVIFPIIKILFGGKLVFLKMVP